MWKTINRHGQKIPGSEAGLADRGQAEQLADRFNSAGYDDGPFTVARWGDEQGWYSAEGHQEAQLERGETL